MVYEICKRKTKCEQCGSVMRKGDKRSRTYERRGRYPVQVYRCNICNPEPLIISSRRPDPSFQLDPSFQFHEPLHLEIMRTAPQTYFNPERLSPPVSASQTIVSSNGNVGISSNSETNFGKIINGEIKKSCLVRLGRMLRPILTKKGD